MLSTSTETVNLTCSLVPEQGRTPLPRPSGQRLVQSRVRTVKRGLARVESPVAASDFNGDGFVDVAWTGGRRNCDLSRRRLWVGRRATHAANPASHACNGQLNGLTAADLTRDGKGDLLATGTGGVYLFAGPLSPLSPRPPSPLPGSPGDAGKAIAVPRAEGRIPDVYVQTATGVVRMSSDASGAWKFSPALSRTGPGLRSRRRQRRRTARPGDDRASEFGSTSPMQVLLRLATPSGGLGNPDVIAQGTDLRAVAMGDADGIERSDVLYAQDRPRRPDHARAHSARRTR